VAHPEADIFSYYGSHNLVPFTMAPCASKQ